MKSGSTILTNNDSIGTGAILSITLADNQTLGLRTGSLKLTATGVANSQFSGASIKTLSLSGRVNVTSISVSQSNVSLNDITSGESSDVKTTQITTSNVEKVVISNIPSGFIIKDGSAYYQNSDEIDLNALLSISISDTDTHMVLVVVRCELLQQEWQIQVSAGSQYKDITLSAVVKSKVATLSASTLNIALDEINTGEPSSIKTTTISSTNVTDIKISEIPSGFVIKSGETSLSNGDSIGTGATLGVSLEDLVTLWGRSGTFKITHRSSKFRIQWK